MYRVAPILLCVGVLGGLWGPSATASVHDSVPSPVAPDTGDAVTTVVQKYLVKGTTEAHLGDYEEAVLYYETALDHAPNAPALLQALADAHEAQGDVATALFYARQAREHGPERLHYHHRLAELQRKADQPRDALRTYKTLLDRFPDDREAYRALATLQSDLGRAEAALDTYRSLLNRVDRPSVAVYRKMLALYRRTGNAEGITETLRALVDRRPNDRTVRRRLGEHHAENGRPEEAFELLKPLAEQRPDDEALQQQVRQLAKKTGRAAASQPDDGEPPATRETRSVDALVRRAKSAFEAGSSSDPDSARLHTARTLAEEALDRAPNHTPALSLLAQIHRAEGAYRKAGRVLERALGENPRDANRWARAGTAYLKATEYETAASVSEEGLLLFPGHAPLARTAAVARLRAGDASRALDHFQTALDLSEDAESPIDTAPLRAGLGLTSAHLERFSEATEAFETALSEAPDHPEVLRRYAYGLALQEKRLDRALKMARRALDQSPSDPQFLDTLGWVYVQRGNLKAARRYLRDALEAGPPTAQILEHLGDVQHALGNDATARKYWQRALDKDADRASLRKKLSDGPSS